MASRPSISAGIRRIRRSPPPVTFPSILPREGGSIGGAVDAKQRTGIESRLAKIRGPHSFARKVLLLEEIYVKQERSVVNEGGRNRSRVHNNLSFNLRNRADK